MKIASFYLGHNANAAFYTPETGYRIIELERYFKKRYFGLIDADNEKIISALMDCLALAKKCWGIDNDFDVCVIGQEETKEKTQRKNMLAQEVVVSKKYTAVHHHVAHISCAFAQSPFPKALVISYDGGGSDGASKIILKERGPGLHNSYLFLSSVLPPGKTFFVMRPSLNSSKTSDGAWHACKHASWNFNLGIKYNSAAYPISQIKNNKGDPTSDLALAGKLMGLSAYGKNIPLLRHTLTEHFLGNSGNRVVVNPVRSPFRDFATCVPYEPALAINSLSGSGALDLAFNAQGAFEDAFEIAVRPHLFAAIEKGLPIVMTGGCSLNVLVNERLRAEFHDKMFVAPNVDDGGLALGQLCEILMPESAIDITYNGLPILDKEDLPKAVKDYGARKVTPSEVAKLCKDGKIIGICTGDSEVGPRALGNRSIICDPSYPKMKDILNSKVKFREYFRPFAPFIREERANEIFEIREGGKPSANMKFMSFAPMVRPRWRDQLPAITHVDGTARLQTVTEDSHKLFNDILVEFEKLSDHGVLLNTSFNIKGLPILTRISDALHILENTDIDLVYIEGYLFSKIGKKK